VHLGEIVESREALAPGEVRHKNASGTDHLRSQMQFQRQDQTHVRWHVRAVSDLLEEMACDHAFGRIVVAGPVEATSELTRLFPRPLADRVIGTVRLPAAASPDDVLREAHRLAEAAERENEETHVGRLFDGGVVGLEATLVALQEGRLRMLVYADGFESRGYECLRCGALFASSPEAACPYCSGSLLPLADLVGRAVARTVGAGGNVDEVHGESAARLLDAGGIGAVLRY
jgi:peptide subunit release factor 1 (eRF1)